MPSYFRSGFMEESCSRMSGSASSLLRHLHWKSPRATSTQKPHQKWTLCEPTAKMWVFSVLNVSFYWLMVHGEHFYRSSHYLHFVLRSILVHLLILNELLCIRLIVHQYIRSSYIMYKNVAQFILISRKVHILYTKNVAKLEHIVNFFPDM